MINILGPILGSMAVGRVWVLAAMWSTLEAGMATKKFFYYFHFSWYKKNNSSTGGQILHTFEQPRISELFRILKELHGTFSVVKKFKDGICVIDPTHQTTDQQRRPSRCVITNDSGGFRMCQCRRPSEHTSKGTKALHVLENQSWSLEQCRKSAFKQAW